MSMQQQDLKILERKTLHKGFCTLQQVRATDGKLELDQEVFDSGDAVAVFLYHPGRRRILFVKQIRIATALNGNPGGRLLEVCAGRTEGGAPEATARREIQEETGYDITELQTAGMVYMSPGVHTQRLYLYAASYEGVTRSGAGGGLPGESEELELIELSYEDVLRMLREGAFNDAKTMILVQWAFMKGLLGN